MTNHKETPPNTSTPVTSLPQLPGSAVEVGSATAGSREATSVPTTSTLSPGQEVRGAVPAPADVPDVSDPDYAVNRYRGIKQKEPYNPSRGMSDQDRARLEAGEVITTDLGQTEVWSPSYLSQFNSWRKSRPGRIISGLALAALTLTTSLVAGSKLLDREPPSNDPTAAVIEVVKSTNEINDLTAEAVLAESDLIEPPAYVVNGVQNRENERDLITEPEFRASTLGITNTEVSTDEHYRGTGGLVRNSAGDLKIITVWHVAERIATNPATTNEGEPAATLFVPGVGYFAISPNAVDQTEAQKGEDPMTSISLSERQRNALEKAIKDGILSPLSVVDGEPDSSHNYRINNPKTGGYFELQRRVGEWSDDRGAGKYAFKVVSVNGKDTDSMTSNELTEASAGICNGDSGGPIFNEEGAVGVVASGQMNQAVDDGSYCATWITVAGQKPLK